MSKALVQIAVLREQAAAIGPILGPDELQRLWNLLSKATGLPACRELNQARRTAANNLLKQHPEREYWIQVLRRIGLSPFCRGQNDRGWQANIDWVLRRSTHLRVLEGRYDGKRASAQGGWGSNDVDG
jgi:hypothetical protein